MKKINGFFLSAIALLAASPASAQSIDCETLFNQTHCNSTPVPAPATQQGQGPFDGMRPDPRELVEQQYKNTVFNQVGALIAKGDCESAKKLTLFYDMRDLTKATARACSQ